MTPDSGILTTSQTQILSVFKAGFGNITPDALHLLGTLTVIELTLAILFWVLKGEDFVVGFIKKIMLVGFFIFLVSGWATLTSTVIQGFVYTGVKAGGGVSVASLSDPSQIIDYAFTVTQPLTDEITTLDKSTWTGMGTSQSWELLIIKYLIIFALFILAIQVFICNIEFYLVAVLALILIPFGVSKHTAFLSEKAIGTVISFGVKLMVLAFILSASMPILQNATLPADPLSKDALCLALIAWAITFLAIQAPSIASGMLAGSPSLTAAGAAAGGAAAGAFAAATAQKIGSAPSQAKSIVSSSSNLAKRGAIGGGAMAGAAINSMSARNNSSGMRSYNPSNSSNLGSNKT